MQEIKVVGKTVAASLGVVVDKNPLVIGLFDRSIHTVDEINLIDALHNSGERRGRGG